MAWLLPARSGQIYRNASGKLYTGTAGVPVNVDDADASGALADGWTRASTQTLPPQGELTPTIAEFATDPLTGVVVGLVGPDGGTVGFPQILKQSAVPVILAPNGTVAVNGTVTLGTALPVIYANAWVRLPAGAVVGGLAGLYYATFSSTTVGVITTTFIDPATAFTPYIPTGTVAAVGSGSAYTQTTAADITLANITVPGGLMGVNGVLRIEPLFNSPNSANNRITKATVAGNVLYNVTMASGTANAEPRIKFRNRGSLSSNMSGLAFVNSLLSNNPANIGYYSVNTAIDQALVFTSQIAVATDYIVLEGFTVEVLPA